MCTIFGSLDVTRLSVYSLSWKMNLAPGLSNHVSMMARISRSGPSARWIVAPSVHSFSEKHSESSSGSEKPHFSAMERHTSCAVEVGSISKVLRAASKGAGRAGDACEARAGRRAAGRGKGASAGARERRAAFQLL